jgi:hypothetical protein
MSNYYTCRDAGLDDAEIAALKAHAETRMADVKVYVDGYSLHPERIEGELNKRQKAGDLTSDQVYELMAIYSAHRLSAEVFKPLAARFEKDEQHGFFTHHPSFGCVSHSVVSSTHPNHVGTPTMSGYETTLRFWEASFGTSFSFDAEPRLSEDRVIVETALSSEQFASLLRNQAAGSPCALGRSAHLLMDMPPRMVGTDTIAQDVKAKAMLIGKPLIDACVALQDYLTTTQKISTKAEYGELQDKVDQVRLEMSRIVAPMKELLSETAGLVAESAMRQMLSELTEPLKALRMDAGDVMRLLEH